VGRIHTRATVRRRRDACQGDGQASPKGHQPYDLLDSPHFDSLPCPSETVASPRELPTPIPIRGCGSPSRSESIERIHEITRRLAVCAGVLACSPEPPACSRARSVLIRRHPSPTSTLASRSGRARRIATSSGDHAAASDRHRTGFPTAKVTCNRPTIRAATPIPSGAMHLSGRGLRERDGPRQYCRVHSDRRADV